jgi:hypothetical protein
VLILAVLGINMCCRATEKHWDAFQYPEESHRSILSQVRRSLPSPPRRHAQSSGEHGAGLYRMTSWFALRVAFRHRVDTTRTPQERMKKARTQRPGACARLHAPPPSLTCCVATFRRTGIWINLLGTRAAESNRSPHGWYTEIRCAVAQCEPYICIPFWI